MNNFCGHWLRLSSSHSLLVGFNQKRTVARKTVAQDEWSLMTEVTQEGLTVFARLIMIMMYFMTNR